MPPKAPKAPKAPRPPRTKNPRLTGTQAQQIAQLLALVVELQATVDRLEADDDARIAKAAAIRARVAGG